MVARNNHNRDECLDPVLLRDIDDGNLSDEALKSVFDHASGCGRCEKFLGEWSGSGEDKFVAKMRQCYALKWEPDASTRVQLRGAARDLIHSQRLTLEANTLPGSAAVIRSLVGITIGHSLVEEELGRGGMGVVFRAVQNKLKRTVAIKVIRAGVYADADHIARFQREAGAIARLQHPNVASLYEFNEFDGMPYFTMEYVDGGPLSDRLKEGPLSCREAAELVVTIAEAVEYAHQKQVIHRDLKPSNILLTKNGVPKIADFGLARMLDDPDSKMTRANAVVGTPSYMAPEQAAGRNSEVGPLTDVYAVGAILYECLTGEPPHKGEDRYETIHSVIHDEPLSPTKRRREVPANLSAICVRCLNKNPKERYQSAQALADDLKLWLNDQRPVGIPSVYRRTRKRLRRNWIAAALVLMAMSGVAALALHDPDRAVKAAQAKIAKGQPVTLIGETGKPEWYRWVEREETSKMTVGEDGIMRLYAFGEDALLELLPAVDAERYRFEVQIRHEKTELHGGVGIFAGRRVMMCDNEPVRMFLDVHFNDIRGTKDLPLIIGGKRPMPQAPNEVTMNMQFYSRPGIPNRFGLNATLKGGSKFEPPGAGNTPWRDLSLTVTPEGVTAEWDKQPFQVSTEAMLKSTNGAKVWAAQQNPPHPFHQFENADFDRRGGLGLMIYGGSAAFRSARVIPLPGP